MESMSQLVSLSQGQSHRC